MRTCTTCGEPLPAQASFCPFDGSHVGAGAGVRGGDALVGQNIDGRYLVLAFLGAGGMARVYLARHVNLGRDVALKVLATKLAGDERLVARFAREARAASTIDHPNVVSVYDFGRSGDVTYIAMAHVVGHGLDAELARGVPFSTERTLHVLSQIAAGLARSHERGIVHRDLKPENVMLTARGSDPDFVKVLDFGLCRPLEPEPGERALTRPLEVFGTPEYMAPERWDTGPADPRSDIYALGVMGYELCAGALPFHGNMLALMHQHLDVRPVPLLEVRPDAHPGLAALVMRCMEKSPDARFQSMRDVLHALGSVAIDVPRRARHTTYARTSAARPPLSADELSDPTVYQTSALDPVWDGPALVGEVQRLHSLRRRLLRELASALWGPQPPAEVAERLAGIERLELGIEQIAEQIALIEARLEEAARSGREQEASLRYSLIEANLELVGIGAARSGEGGSSHGSGLEDTVVASDPRAWALAGGGDPRERQRHAEQRLVSLHRRSTREELELGDRLTTNVGMLCRLEAEMTPVVEALSADVRRASIGRPALRQQVLAFFAVDGALASYQALLDALGEQAQ